MAEYIERDAATKLLRKRGLEAGEKFGSDFASGIFDAMRFLQEQTSADVAPVVHAKWKDIEQGEASNLCECSNCKEWVNLYFDFAPDYCPCCGAKMDLEG